ncbi:MAG: glycoside hydrolase family 88 protein [Alistipes sp.]|nr:glycoside hydrolase family 88 protein [Alistipes sp.]
MRKLLSFVVIVGSAVTLFAACQSKLSHLERAEQMRANIYKLYDVDRTALLSENYPLNTPDQVTYLANGLPEFPNQYSFLWPYSGTLSMMSALYEANGLEDCLKFIDNNVLAGLDMYFDKSRQPYGYSSYITVAKSDRFYDDNIWLAIDFTDLYKLTNDKKYLDRALQTWEFVMSGYDEKLDGGIYWCEQTKESKNACSNAPAAVCALKLYEATGDAKYLELATSLYDWTVKWLYDERSGLFSDNVNIENQKVARAKYSYNTGQMIQAAAKLHLITKEPRYLEQAQAYAEASFKRWFKEHDGGVILESGDIWFDAVLLRGLIELYQIDGNAKYIDAVDHTLSYAWENGRDEQGLFGKFLSHQEEGKPKRWLLNQAAYAEMSARMAIVKR